MTRRQILGMVALASFGCNPGGSARPLDVPEPGVCGDGVLDLDEDCDLGSANSPTGVCRPDCRDQECGDGSVGPGEVCDDGNALDDDACTSLCQTAVCGDGLFRGG